MFGTRGSRIPGARRFGTDITNTISQNYNQIKQSTTQTTQQKHKETVDAIHSYTQQIVQLFNCAQMNSKSMETEGEVARGEVTDKMRQILVDWLVDVHQSFGLKEETLYLGVIYLDQYQKKQFITRDDYQLVGITCLWIASKYQEIYPPNIKKYVQVTARTYSAGQIKSMEGDVLRVLGFNLTKVSPLALLNAHSHQLSNSKALLLVKYLLQLSLLHGSLMGKYGLRVCVGAAVFLSDSILGLCEMSCKELFEGLIRGQVECCSKQMSLFLKLENKFKLSAIRRKYSKQNYQGVGRILLQK